MPLALSLAWRLLLAIALIASPIAGLASEGGCGMRLAVQAKSAPIARAAADAMPGCGQMAAITPSKSPQGKADPAQPASGHATCTASACCLGGVVGVAGLALTVEAMPVRETLGEVRGRSVPTPPSGRMLRPPIA